MREEDPDVSNWEKVVKLVQAVLCEGSLVEACAWKTFMLIPKGDIKDFRRIYLVEVMRKATTGIINQRLTAAITYHDSLHGFCMGRGAGTAILEDNLLHHLAAMREVVLHAVFLDLQKAYDALDQDWCLNILEGYIVGPQTLRLLPTYLDRLQVVAKADGYFVPPFHGYRGVTQGNTFFPTVFNVVVDSVIHHWLTVVAPTEAGAEGLGETVQELVGFF